MRIEPHEAVLTDNLPGIYAFIARDNPAAAREVLDALEATFDQVARQPECGGVYPTRNPRLKDVRMLPVRGFPGTSSSTA